MAPMMQEAFGPRSETFVEAFALIGSFERRWRVTSMACFTWSSESFGGDGHQLRAMLDRGAELVR